MQLLANEKVKTGGAQQRGVVVAISNNTRSQPPSRKGKQWPHSKWQDGSIITHRIAPFSANPMALCRGRRERNQAR